MSSHEGGGIASPGPAALAALVIVCFAFFAVLTGKVPPTVMPYVLGWCVAGGIVQIIAGVLMLLKDDLVGGTTFFVFGAFFILAIGISNWVQYIAVVTKIPISPALNGYLFLAMELILIVLSPSFLMLSPTFFAVLIIADIAVGFIAAVYLKMVGLIGLLVAGWALLALGILGLYLILAIVFNETYGSVVFPVGGPVIKRRVS